MGRTTALSSLVLVALLLFVVWHVVVVDRDKELPILADNTSPSLDYQWGLLGQPLAFNSLDNKRCSGDFIRNFRHAEPSVVLLLATIAMLEWPYRLTSGSFSPGHQVGSSPNLVLRL